MSDYIVKVKFVGDKVELKKMEKDLNTRFTKIANNFGKRLLSGIKASAVGLILAMVTNPFEKVNQELTDILKRYKEFSDSAIDLGVNAGELAKVRNIALEQGVSTASFDAIFSKFVDKLEQSRDETNKDRTLEQFTGFDNLVAFDKVLKSIKDAPESERNRLSQEVFGSRFGSDLQRLASTDWEQRNRALYGRQTSAQVGANVKKISDVALHDMALEAARNVDNLNAQSGLIGFGTSKLRDDIQRQEDSSFLQDLEKFGEFAEMKKIEGDILKEVKAIRNMVYTVLGWLYKKITGNPFDLSKYGLTDSEREKNTGWGLETFGRQSDPFTNEKE